MGWEGGGAWPWSPHGEAAGPGVTVIRDKWGADTD